MRIEQSKRNKSDKKTTRTATGKAAKSGNTTRLNVNVPRAMYRQLRIKAAENDTSVSRAVIGLIENYVARR